MTGEVNYNYSPMMNKILEYIGKSNTNDKDFDSLAASIFNCLDSNGDGMIDTTTNDNISFAWRKVLGMKTCTSINIETFKTRLKSYILTILNTENETEKNKSYIKYDDYNDENPNSSNNRLIHVDRKANISTGLYSPYVAGHNVMYDIDGNRNDYKGVISAIEKVRYGDFKEFYKGMMSQKSVSGYSGKPLKDLMDETSMDVLDKVYSMKKLLNLAIEYVNRKLNINGNERLEPRLELLNEALKDLEDNKGNSQYITKNSAERLDDAIITLLNL